MLEVPDDVPLKELSDEQLVELYRRGRTEAFNEVVQRYQRELFHFLVRFLGGRAAAEDVFQETFLQVHISIDSFDTSRRFRPWLFTISANKARDYLRRSRGGPASLSASIGAAGGAPASEDESQVAFVDLMEADLPRPSDEAQRQEIRHLVQKTVAQMPEHLREVLILAYFHRFAYKEVAEMLGIPLGTVKSRLHAAVATFSQIWKQHYGELSAQ